MILPNGRVFPRYNCRLHKESLFKLNLKERSRLKKKIAGKVGAKTLRTASGIGRGGKGGTSSSDPKGVTSTRQQGLMKKINRDIYSTQTPTNCRLCCIMFFFVVAFGQGFRVLPVFSKGADEFFSPPKKFFFTSA